MRSTKRILHIGMVSGVILAGMTALGWGGLHVRPAAFPPVPPPAAAPATVPLPAGLPAPVDRFYRRLYGERVPVISSAMISGRGTLRLFGLRFPARFRFVHDAGHAYRHYIETTVFGRALMQVNERFVHGHGRMELPFGIEEGAQIDQGANLALWAEAIWLPALWATDSRVRWESIDDVTAVLVVPPAEGTNRAEDQERFIVRFDPATGMPWLLESMRYRGSAGAKTLWLNQIEAWGMVGTYTLPTVTAVTWADEGTPWASFTVEDVAYNVDVASLPTATGP